MAAPLPDPQWQDRAAICIACGYSLEGLAIEGCCPECGAVYTARQLVIAGVPTRAGAGGWRSAAWAVLIVVGVIHAYTWTLQLMLSPWVAVFVTFGFFGALIALVSTNKRERGGTERFVITPGGIQRLPMKFDAGSTRLDSIYVPWGAADDIELRRISSVWRRLRIGKRVRTGIDPIFDAGIRCPDAMAAEVHSIIAGAIEGRQDFRESPVPTAPPTVPTRPPTGR
jgi:hypothetical protein